MAIESKTGPRARRSRPQSMGDRYGVSPVTQKGQITISAGLRRALGIKPGDHVRLTRQDDGTIRVERMKTFDEIVAFAPRVPAVDWKAAREEIAEEAAQKNSGILRRASERRDASR